MSNLFSGLTTEGLEEVQDRLGGYQPLDSDIYVGTIKALYAGQSQSGAKSLTLIADLGGQEYRETLYVTNKEGKNYFMARDRSGKETGKKAPLPGFTHANDLCLIACEKELHEMIFEEKIIKVWDPDQKAEVPTAVPMATEALGKPIALGILKKLENKTVKNESTGKYVATAEERYSNAIDKVFHPELKVTVREAREGKPATFWDAWLERNKGEILDRREIKDGQAAAAGGPPKAGAPAATAAPRKSLFGK